MTWNRSASELKDLLEQANTWHPNIKLHYKISKSLPFLDILLTNNNGHLSTLVYHKPAAELYVIPFISDHPRHVCVNVINNQLAHDLKYSSTFEAFNHKRRYIKLMLLYNGYPSSFIQAEHRKFFMEHVSSTSLLPFIDNKKQFFNMRNKLLSLPTYRQSQMVLSRETAETDNDQILKMPQSIATASKTGNNQTDEKFKNKLFIHYIYEKRFRPMKRGLHKIHKGIFHESATKSVKMIVGNRNHKNAIHKIIRKRPKQSLLKNEKPGRE